jgi:hypothetical protein
MTTANGNGSGNGRAIAPLSPNQIAALDQLATAGAAVVASHPQAGGELLLRMQKGDGMWVYGQGDTEVQPGSQWAVNPFQCAHGYICWAVDPKAATKKLGEAMVPITAPKADPTSLPPISGGSWSEQIGLSVLCMTGEDKGINLTYKSNAQGGMERAVKLIAAIVERARARNPEFVPIVTLESDFYQHKTYGKIFKPIFNIRRWTTLDSPDGGTETAAASEPPPAKPKGRPPVGEAAQPAEPQAAPGEPVRKRRARVAAD